MECKHAKLEIEKSLIFENNKVAEIILIIVHTL